MISSRSLNVHGISVYKKRRSLSQITLQFILCKWFRLAHAERSHSTGTSLISCVLGGHRLCLSRLPEFFILIRLIWIIIDWEQIGFGFQLHRFFSKVNYVKLGLRLLMIWIIIDWEQTGFWRKTKKLDINNDDKTNNSS